MTSSASRSSAIRTVAGAIVVATIVGCGMSLTVALLGVRLDAAGFSAHAIGINTAAGGVATLFGAPCIPWMARKLGVARLLMGALVIGGVALLGFTLSDDYTMWLALRFVLGLVVTINFVLSEFWITTWAPAGHRGFAIGLYATSLAIGFAVGPVLLAVIGTAGNMPFYLAAALFIGAAVPLAFNSKGAPPLEVRSAKTLFDFLREAPGATLAAVLQGAVEVAGLGLLPVYALRAGLSVADGAIFASLFILGSCALQMPLGLLADRYDQRKILIALAAIGCLGAIVLAEIGVAYLLVFDVMLLLWGSIVCTFYPVGLSQLATRFRGADLAGANSAFVVAYAMGMLAGPPLIGAGLDVAPSGFFWVIAVLLAVYATIAGAHLFRASGWRRSFP